MEGEIMKIDVAAVLRERVPQYYRWMPRFVVRWIERLICQDELNAILQSIGHQTGVDAARQALSDLDITLRVEGLENVPAAGRYIFASNHPLGGLDGMALIQVLGDHYGGHVRFLVNDLLMAVKPLNDVFLPVNKYGRQSRSRVKDIEEAYSGSDQMITFPAGLCSRKERGGAVQDLRWNKAIVTMAAAYGRDVVPVFFGGRNSEWFYRLARWRKKLGIKFNAEMILLPREMIKSRGTTFNIVIGKPVPCESFDVHNAVAEAARLRDMVYAMSRE